MIKQNYKDYQFENINLLNGTFDINFQLDNDAEIFLHIADERVYVANNNNTNRIYLGEIDSKAWKRLANDIFKDIYGQAVEETKRQWVKDLKADHTDYEFL